MSLGNLQSSLALGMEAGLILPDLSKVQFLGLTGYAFLLPGLLLCLLGMLFGLVIFIRLKSLPVHPSMDSISQIIWATCKTYLVKQGRFLFLLWLCIASIMALYFCLALKNSVATKILVILFFSILGMSGSYCLAWFGIRINTFANSRTAFASLSNKPAKVYRIPLQAGMSVGMMLISIELMMMLIILLFVPGNYAGPCFVGFAIGESLGAVTLRIAGGIFTKIADISADMMKIVLGIKEDDARNPGVIADCVGDNAGDSVGPTADGFETYGVTQVALITFILLGVNDPLAKTQLLVWIFAIRLVMLVAACAAYFINHAWTKLLYHNKDSLNFEAPLSSLVWISCISSITLTFIASYAIIPDVLGDVSVWWKLSMIISCGTLAGAVIPQLVKVFTSMRARHVRQIVVSAEKGQASLDILSGLVTGNFSSYYLGIAITLLMAIGSLISFYDLQHLMLAPAVFGFGLVAFGFLGMGPVTIAVDSYGPVADNGQSVFELSLIEQEPNVSSEVKKYFNTDVDFARARKMLEASDGAGNTFKATSKPVLIGTAVVGATTMIFSIVIILTNGLRENIDKLSLLYPPFVLGLACGGAVVYWFTGASIQAVTSGSYRAVAFIKDNIRLELRKRASMHNSNTVVEICTQYAQKGLLNIFIALFFITLSFAFIEPFFFIGYLISLAMFGLYQAIFMANAGAAWDNAKKIVEVELRQKNTPLHQATIVGDTVGDPFKDTSAVSLNPVIKFTTLFGLLAVELSLHIEAALGPYSTHVFAASFFAVASVFVYRSYYHMRILSKKALV